MRSLSLRISGTLLATILICIGTTTAQETSAQVWANSRSHVYHCPGSPFYGNTKSGRYMTEAKAVTSGYRAAGGMTCTGGTAVPPNQGTHIAECGIERWPVKILADHDHAKVNLTPVDTTVHELCSRKRPHRRFPYDRRVAQEELTTYRLRARLVRIRHERDSDLHLLLVDPGSPSDRMIAEIPAPECAVGTGLEETYRRTRQAVLTMKLGAVVEVTGVGFFDFMHEQRGVAPNGIELHPVLDIRVPE
jgi:hypothetical protein